MSFTGYIAPRQSSSSGPSTVFFCSSWQSRVVTFEVPRKLLSIMGWISPINRLGLTPLSHSCRKQVQFLVTIDGKCAELFLRLYEIVQDPMVPPQTTLFHAAAPNVRYQAFPAMSCQDGGPEPGKRARGGPRRRSLNDTLALAV